MQSATVLFVNSFDDRHVYTDVLRERGHTIIDAAVPEEALRCLALGTAPDVVVSDIVFIGSAISGPSFVRTLRDRVDDATSIVVLSGYMRADDRDQARAAGADLFVMK